MAGKGSEEELDLGATEFPRLNTDILKRLGEFPRLNTENAKRLGGLLMRLGDPLGTIFDDRRIRAIDPSIKETYVKALTEGKEKSASLRVMVVGHYDVGKSTVTRRLLGIPVETVESTNGIDIHVHKCKISNEGTWEKEQVDVETEHIERLLTVAQLMKQPQEPGGKIRHRYPTKGSTNEAESIRKFATALKIKKSSKGLIADRSKCINIWDFGGQLIFYATHQLFHSPNAIYLLVLDLSKGLDELIHEEDYENVAHDRDVRSYCKFWIHSIHSFVGTLDGNPPVILVGTHLDMVPGNETEKAKYADKYFDEVRDIFNETPMLQHFQHREFIVDNLTTEDNLKQLRDYIVSVGDVNAKENPAKWIPLESSLTMIQSRKHITFNQACKIASEHKITKTELLAFLAYHNSQGTLFYFNEPGLSECVILDPQWIIDALKCIITSGKFCKKTPSLRQFWDELMNTAVLRSTLIKEVWRNDGKNDFSDHMDVLLQYMTKFGIVAKQQCYDEETYTPIKMDFYVVPSLLRNHSMDYVHAFVRGRPSTSTSLVFKLENDSVSPTLYHRTTAAALAMWPVVKYEGKCLLFEDVGIYRLDMLHAGIIEVTNQTIKIRVVNLGKQAVSSEQSDRLRRFLEMVLKHELGRFRSQQEHYKLGIRCTRCPVEENENSESVIDLDEIKSHEIVPCPALTQGHEINVQTTMREWYTQERLSTQISNSECCEFKYPCPSAFEEQGEQNMSSPTSILACYDSSQLNRKVTEKDLNKISNAIGFNWELLASYLGISLATCDQIKMDYPYSSVLQIHSMLVKWKNINGENAILKTILVGLEINPSVTVDWDLIKNFLDNFEW